MATFVSILYLLMLIDVVYASDPLIVPREIDTMCQKQFIVTKPTLISSEGNTDSRDCVFRVRAKSQHKMKIMFQYSSVHVTGLRCIDDKIHISVNNPDTRISSGVQQPCDVINTDYDLESASEEMTINLYSSWIKSNTAEGFQLLIVPFHIENCTSDEYRCKNGHCIDETLKCNSNYISCGNDNCSPLQYQPSSLIMDLSIIAVLILIIVTIVGCLIWWCFRKRRLRQRCPRLRSTIEDRLSPVEMAECSTLRATSPMIAIPSAPVYIPISAPPPYSLHPTAQKTFQIDSKGVYSEQREVTPLENHNSPPPYER